MEALPAPLPMQILKMLPDIKCLDAVTRASPTFAAAFYYDAVEILEAIMHSTLPRKMIHLLRAYMLLHAGLTDIAAFGRSHAVTKLYSAGSKPLPRIIPTFTVATLVRAFTQLHSLTIAIIDTKLRYLTTLSFQHLADKSCPAYDGEDPSRYNPIGISYDIGPSSSPSWIEELRVMRALWNVKLITHLVMQRSGSPEEQRRIFASLRPHPSGGIFVRDEVEEIVDSLRNLSTSHVDLATMPSFYVSLPTCGDIPSVPYTWTSPAALPEHASADMFSRTPMAWFFFKYACKRLLHSPLHDADWSVFRSLGLGLWDSRRMIEQLQLEDIPSPIRGLVGNSPTRQVAMLSAWSSVPVPLHSETYATAGDDAQSKDQLFTWWHLYLQELGRRKTAA